MPKLKLSAIPDDKPVKMTVTFTAEQAATLEAYAEAVSRDQSRSEKLEPARLVPLIVDRFIATDRAFARSRPSGGVRPPRQGSADAT